MIRQPARSASASLRLGLLLVLLVTVMPGSASAQLGALVSPGRLNKAHAELEGITQCWSCHTAGRQVAADKCLSCHEPVARRIAAKRGVHRNVTTDCVSCHVEHAGVNSELRPFDQKAFDHNAETAFALDGLHATPSATCASCHTTRTFLNASTRCSTCHDDPHKGTLGTTCATCHPTDVAFARTKERFDHSSTTFQLTGAHAGATCESCHANGNYKRAAPATCATCHTDPHERQFGATCSTCHGTTSWATTRVNHQRTDFPLVGSHTKVACASCHTGPSTSAPVRHDTCATCHQDPHLGTFKEDCASCHNETTFTKGTFDHSTTTFPLVDGHVGPTCIACHKQSAVVAPVAARPAARPSATRLTRTFDFKGLGTACASCHADPHKAELGTTCQSCHSSKTFRVDRFTHTTTPAPFFEGAHTEVRCEQCHVPTGQEAPAAVAPGATPRLPALGLARTSTVCASCHTDPHLGQVGARCESCHAINAPKFAVTGFSHADTEFPLTGKHAPLLCDACHKTETARFPASSGTAVRLTGIGTSCAVCHEDPHASQLGTTCDQCHSAETFRLPTYAHKNARTLKWFFAGPHQAASCETCHKTRPPGPRATTLAPVVAYNLTTTCTNCHEDRHRGALGTRCESCHRLN